MYYFAITPLTKLYKRRGSQLCECIILHFIGEKSGMGLTKLKWKCPQASLVSGGSLGQSHLVSWQNWIHGGWRNKASISLLVVSRGPYQLLEAVPVLGSRTSFFVFKARNEGIKSFSCGFLLTHYFSAFLSSPLSTHTIRRSPPRSSGVVSPAPGLHPDSRQRRPLISLFVYEHDWSCFLHLIFIYFIERYRHKMDLYALIS